MVLISGGSDGFRYGFRGIPCKELCLPISRSSRLWALPESDSTAVSVRSTIIRNPLVPFNILHLVFLSLALRTISLCVAVTVDCEGVPMSHLGRTRRVLSACVPLVHRIAGGKPLGLLPRHLERSFSTSSSLCPREDAAGSQARLWSRASFERSKFASGYTALAPKKLEQIMKIETVIFSPPEEITQIWNDYHIGRGHISAVMGSELYKVFEQRATDCPLFVLPLKKGSGFISVVVQAQMPYMLFTALEDYRARGSEASPYFTVTHFTELVPTKDLVLVRGDIVFTSKLSDDEAETLLKTAHSFYINDERYRKVRKFNKDSREFDFKEVLHELNIPLQG